MTVRKFAVAFEKADVVERQDLGSSLALDFQVLAGAHGNEDGPDAEFHHGSFFVG